MSTAEDGARTGKFRRGIEDITRVHVTGLIDELTLFPVERQKICVADVGGVGFTTSCFESSFACLGGQCAPESGNDTFHGFTGMRGSLTRDRTSNRVIAFVGGRRAEPTRGREGDLRAAIARMWKRGESIAIWTGTGWTDDGKVVEREGGRGWP